jgi:protein required for attachment to host cells
MTTYIVVADAARARIFTREGRELSEQEDLFNAEGRLHEGDLVTDLGSDVNNEVPVRSSGSSGEHDTAREHEVEFFAKQVVEYLQKARTDNRLDKLVLVASPRFLGRLRDNLDTATRDLVIGTLDKELTKASPDEIREAVSDLR